MGGGPTAVLSVVALLVASLAALSTTVQAQLVENFYRTSCPSAESVITSAVNSALNRRAASAAGVLRIHFHDCFVRVSCIPRSPVHGPLPLATCRRVHWRVQ